MRKRKLEAQVEKAAPGPPTSSGRRLYFKELLEQVRVKHGDKSSVALNRVCMRIHARLYERLPAAAKLAYERQAQENRLSVARNVFPERARLLEELDLVKQRARQDRAVFGLPNTVNSVRFDGEDSRALQAY